MSSLETPMEASGLIQSLDTLWFFSNILSEAQQIPGLASDQEKPAEMDPDINAEAKLGTLEPEHSPECTSSEELALAEDRAEEKESSSGEVRKKKIRSKKSPFDRQRRKVLGGLDLGCIDGWRRDRQPWLVVDEMPPLSDGMAMKEHLKCWAYAVACTVK